MGKFHTGLVVLSAVFLPGVLGGMKGGQILEQPLPYTVYILTGDRDDVFHNQKSPRQSYNVQEGSSSAASAKKGEKSGLSSSVTKSMNVPTADDGGVASAVKTGLASDKTAPNIVRSIRNEVHPVSANTSTVTVIRSEFPTSTDHHTSTIVKAEDRPVKLWRFCMGVIFDELTILTADICLVRTEGHHFFISVNETNHDSAQEITIIAEGRNQFDFRVIRLNENQTMPGLVPDWQDEDTVYWNLEELSNSSATGIVPSFGYKQKVAAMKLLPTDTCKRVYHELMVKYPAQTATLPGFLHETAVCATQADKPIDFPDRVGLVQPGQACPDSLGAPFVLLDGTILGVLVAADCKDKHVSFFQTLGKGIPDLEEEEEDEEIVDSLNGTPSKVPSQVPINKQ